MYATITSASRPVTMETNTTTENTSSTTMAPNSVGTGSTPEIPVPEKASDFFLRFATRAKPFKLPDWSEVTATGMQHFVDPTLRCLRRRYGAEYIYIYHLTKPAPIENQRIKFVCNGVELTFDLTTENPFERTGNRNRTQGNPTRGNRAPTEREKGVLITFQNAGMREYDGIPNADFDKAVMAFNLHVIVPTRMQPVPGCQGSFNGNRFCVIRIPEDMNMIPEFLPVRTPQGKLFNFKSTYKDQARQCDVCLVKHVGPCPRKKAMFEAREKKEKMREEGEVVSKIVSDSTLRLANPDGTKSDICTMSGGGLGQVTQAVFDDPDTDNMKEIFIVGGANDVKYDKFSLHQFCENIEVSLKKVEELAATYPDKSITLVTSPPQPDAADDDSSDFDDDETIDLEEEDELGNTWLKKEYLQRRVNKMITDSEGKNLRNLHSLQIQYGRDESGHPTHQGTREILEQIATKSDADNFIWDDRFIYTDKMYTMVQSIYLYGCNMCDKYGADVSHNVNRCRLLCDSCFEIVQANADKDIYPLLEDIMAEQEESEHDWNDDNVANTEKADGSNGDGNEGSGSATGQKRFHNNSSGEEEDDAKRIKDNDVPPQITKVDPAEVPLPHDDNETSI